MRYLVTARVKPGRRPALDRAIQDGTLGAGSIAGEEYQSRHGAGAAAARWFRQMGGDLFLRHAARRGASVLGALFDLLSVKDAHARSRCRHENGTEYWACSSCDCTERLEARLKEKGEPFVRPKVKVQSREVSDRRRSRCRGPSHRGATPIRFIGSDRPLRITRLIVRRAAQAVEREFIFADSAGSLESSTRASTADSGTAGYTADTLRSFCRRRVTWRVAEAGTRPFVDDAAGDDDRVDRPRSAHPRPSRPSPRWMRHR